MFLLLPVTNATFTVAGAKFINSGQAWRLSNIVYHRVFKKASQSTNLHNVSLPRSASIRLHIYLFSDKFTRRVTGSVALACPPRHCHACVSGTDITQSRFLPFSGCALTAARGERTCQMTTTCHGRATQTPLHSTASSKQWLTDRRT